MRHIRPWPLPLAALTLLLTAPPPVAAQSCPLAPGCVQEQQQTFPFSLDGLSLWGPEGSSVPGFQDLNTWSLEWDSSDSDGDTTTVSTILGNTYFGGSIYGGSKAHIASTLRFFGYESGDFDVSYPVSVTVTAPEPNTFRPGDAVTISTAWTVDDPNLRIRHRTPGVQASLDFQFRAEAGFTVCVFDCSEKQSAFPTIDIPLRRGVISTVDDGKWGVFSEEATLDPIPPQLVAVRKAVTGEGTWVYPDPDALADQEVDGTRVVAQGLDSLYRIEQDYDRSLQYYGWIPAFPPLGASLPLSGYTGVSGHYETFDMEGTTVVYDREFLAFDVDGVLARVDLGMPLGYEVRDPAGQVTDEGTAPVVEVPVGHDLVIYFPDDVSPLTLQPTFTLVRPNVNRRAWGEARSSIDAEALSLGLGLDSMSFSRSRQEDHGKYKHKNCSRYSDDPLTAEYWDKRVPCEAAALFDQVKAATSSWWYWASNWVTQIYNYAFGGKSFDLGPVYEENYRDVTHSVTLIDDSWDVEGFGSFSGAAWTLDPEDPRISVTTSVANALWTTGQNPGQVIQTITVNNEGDVPLSVQDVLDALSAPGLTVEALASADVTANGTFDGLTDPETVAAGTIDVGSAATLTVRMSAAPGSMHSLSVDARGRSPIGTDVTAEAAASFAVYDMVMSPYVVKHKLRGDPEDDDDDDKAKIKARICSSDALDASAIDGSSLRLEGVAPRKVKFKRHDDDDDDDDDPDKCPGSYLEATFDRGDVVAALLARTEAQTTAPALIAAPVLELTLDRSPADVAEALLLGTGLSAQDASLLDRLGNANGQMDLGDLRAHALRDPVVQATVKKGKKKSSKSSKSGKSGKSSKSEKSAKSSKSAKKPPTHTVVLAGSVGGTPLWAEAPIHVQIKKEDD